MHNLTSTAGIVAMAAGAVAVVALIFCLVLAVKLRRLRSAQRAILGDRDQDIVSHAAALQQQFAALSGYVEEAAEQLERRLQHAERRIDRAVSYRALIHYDAYGDMSGQRSTSIALLDATRSGLVLSSIHHRDQARLYAKEVREGKPELELSPEENEAINRALRADGRQQPG